MIVVNNNRIKVIKWDFEDQNNLFLVNEVLKENLSDNKMYLEFDTSDLDLDTSITISYALELEDLTYEPYNTITDILFKEPPYNTVYEYGT